MKAKIEHPRVFISYAWGDKSNQQKVLSFSSELVKNGVDVLLDRWNLKEGNDKYSYMEKSVTDTSVTNVLLLLDENYTNKANSRTGGVGDETQIISPEIYGKVEQSKFIPIIFSRGNNGEIYKPTYLKSTLHIDLSEAESYDENFMYLVKLLYGVEIYKKPELGTKPSFVEEEGYIPIKTKDKFQNIEKQSNVLAKTNALKTAFENLSDSLCKFETNFSSNQASFFGEYLKKYQETQSLLEELRELTNISLNMDDCSKIIGCFYENSYNACCLKNDANSEIRMMLLHEMFLSTVAILLKHKCYAVIGGLLGRTYFIKSKYSTVPEAMSFSYLYCRDFQNLDNAVNLRDNKFYHTGEGCVWMERISPNHCSHNDFSLADILCYNYTLFVDNSTDLDYYWFPLTYIYGVGHGNNVLASFSSYLKSNERFKEILSIFNLDKETFSLLFIFWGKVWLLSA